MPKSERSAKSETRTRPSDQINLQPSRDRAIHSAFSLIELLLLIAILSVPLLPALAQTTFAKITTGAVVSDAANSGGAAWVDFDNDGYLDLYVNNGDGANLLYRNDG